MHSAWAHEEGYRLAGRTLKWNGYLMLRASRVIIVELTAECGLSHEQVVLADGRVYVWQPASIGVGGGPGYGLARIEGLSARSFEPLGRGFLRDARHVQSWWGGVVVGADRASFEVLDCPDFGEPWFRARDRHGCFVEEDGGRIVRAAP